MKFSTREDVGVPIEAAFDMLCDFEGFERSAMRRGAEVQRLDELRQPGPGMAWAAVFELRGKRRELELEIVTFDRPNEIVLETTSPGLIGEVRFELIALSRNRTRLQVSIEVKPLNLSARLMVQSMKLAKARLDRKFRDKVAEYAKGMEDRYAART